MHDLKKKLESISGVALILAGLMIPFSVAASNALLAVALSLGILSGRWWQGMHRLWEGARALTVLALVYLAWIPLGLFWSLDRANGVEVLQHQWYWLLVPLCAQLFAQASLRRNFLLALSLGLAMHLGLCVIQALGLIRVPTDGSNMHDATGLIGHIGFGAVYAPWAAWLFYLALSRNTGRRWIYLLLSLWAAAMVFLAQGRAGYVVMALSLTVVALRWAMFRFSRRRAFGVALLIAFVTGSLLVLGPGRERMVGTWQAWKEASNGGNQSRISRFAKLSVQERVSVLRASWVLWRRHPWLGSGTGSFAHEARPVYRRLAHAPLRLAHPHNQYLLAMVRWGVFGLLSLLGLLLVWLRLGWRMAWGKDVAAPLVFLSGWMLLIDGLFSISLEQHFSALMALLLLAAGLAAQLAGNRDTGEAANVG